MVRPTHGRKLRQLSHLSSSASDRDRGNERSWKFANAAARHPLTLLLAGFILTGGVGTVLQYEYQERQKDKEATVKSLDDTVVQLFFCKNDQAIPW
jgi:hypothetical protein